MLIKSYDVGKLILEVCEVFVDDEQIGRNVLPFYIPRRARQQNFDHVPSHLRRYPPAVSLRFFSVGTGWAFLSASLISVDYCVSVLFVHLDKKARDVSFLMRPCSDSTESYVITDMHAMKLREKDAVVTRDMTRENEAEAT